MSSHWQQEPQLESLASYVVITGQGRQIVDKDGDIISNGRKTYFSYATFPRLEDTRTQDYKEFCRARKEGEGGEFKGKLGEDKFKEKCQAVIRLQIIAACKARLAEWNRGEKIGEPVVLAFPTPSAFLKALSKEQQTRAKELFAGAIVAVTQDASLRINRGGDFRCISSAKNVFGKLKNYFTKLQTP